MLSHALVTQHEKYYSIHGILAIHLKASTLDVLRYFDKEFSYFGNEQKGVPIEICIASQEGSPQIGKEGAVALKSGVFYSEKENALILTTDQWARGLDQKDIALVLKCDLFSENPSPVEIFFRNNPNKSLTDIVKIFYSRYFLHDTRSQLEMRLSSIGLELLLPLLYLMLPKLEHSLLHSSCVARNGRGLIIHGGEGAGKTSLLLELCTRGYDLVTDDLTIISSTGVCYGFPSTVKLEGLELVNKYGLMKKLSGNMSFWERVVLKAGMLGLRKSDSHLISGDVDIRDIMNVTTVNEAKPSIVLHLRRWSKDHLEMKEMDQAGSARRLLHGLLYEFEGRGAHHKYIGALAYARGVNVVDFLSVTVQKIHAIISQGLSNSRSVEAMVPLGMNSKELADKVLNFLH